MALTSLVQLARKQNAIVVTQQTPRQTNNPESVLRSGNHQKNVDFVVKCHAGFGSVTSSFKPINNAC